VVDLVDRQPGVLNGLVEGLAAPLDQVGREFIELERDNLMSRCLGPSAVAVTNGRFIWVS